MQTFVKGLRLANLNDVVGGNDELGGEMPMTDMADMPSDMSTSDMPTDMTMSDMPMTDTFGDMTMSDMPMDMPVTGMTDMPATDMFGDTTSSGDAMTYGDPMTYGDTAGTTPMADAMPMGDDTFGASSTEPTTGATHALQTEEQPNVILANAVPQTQHRPDVDAIQQYLQQPRDLLRVDPEQQRLYQEQRDRAIDRVESMDRQNYVDRQNLPADVEQRVQEQIRREPVLTNPTQQDPFTVPGLPPRWDKGRPHGYDLGRPGNPFGPVGPRLVPPGR